MTDYHELRTPVDAAAAVQSELLAALQAAQGRHNLFLGGEKAGPITLVVGVSGGVDSITLLHALVQLAGEWRLELHVAHLDHALRPGSAADASFVARCAAHWGLPFYLERLAPGALLNQPGGLEAAARRARYRFLARVAINVTPPAKVPLVVVAHHADDQAETLLLNLVRGSGLQGLGAMRPVTELDQHGRTIRLIRPLLAVRRPTILAYAGAQGLAWREDPTNRTSRFLRNRVRYEILPRLAQINPNIVATLGRTAEIIAADSARLAQSDEQMLQQLACGEPTQERVVLDLNRLLVLDQGAQRGVLRRTFVRLASPGLEPGFEQIEGLLAQVRHQVHAGGPHPLAGELAWTVVGATSMEPLRLSLHRTGALPVALAHPHLDEAWRSAVGAAPLLQEGVQDQVHEGVQDRVQERVIATPDGWQLHVQRLDVRHLPADWRERSDPWAAYLDAAWVGEPVLTTPRRGQQIAPLGMGGRHKAVGDLFTDAKIPTALRSGWPLILDQASQTVLWVCGLAVAQTARITETTASFLRLQWQHPAVEPCAPM